MNNVVINFQYKCTWKLHNEVIQLYTNLLFKQILWTESACNLQDLFLDLNLIKKKLLNSKQMNLKIYLLILFKFYYIYFEN